MLGFLKRRKNVSNLSFGNEELYYLLYSIECNGAYDEYLTHIRMHGDELRGDESRIHIDINVDADQYDDISPETIEKAELMLAAILHEELDLIFADRKDSDGLLP